MKIKIDGLDPTDVLFALYNNAHFEGPRFHHQPVLSFLVKRIAAKANWKCSAALIDRLDKNNVSLSFDYVDLGAGLRPLHVDLSGIEFNSYRYDRCHGSGLAAKVITSLRDVYVQQFKSYKDKDGDFKQLLWQINTKKLAEITIKQPNPVPPRAHL